MEKGRIEKRGKWKGDGWRKGGNEKGKDGEKGEVGRGRTG